MRASPKVLYIMLLHDFMGIRKVDGRWERFWYKRAGGELWLEGGRVEKEGGRRATRHHRSEEEYPPSGGGGGECAVIAPWRQLTISIFYCHQKRKSLDVRPLEGKYVNLVFQYTSAQPQPLATHNNTRTTPHILLHEAPTTSTSTWVARGLRDVSGRKVRVLAVVRFSALSKMQLNFWRMEENFPIINANSQDGFSVLCLSTLHRMRGTASTSSSVGSCLHPRRTWSNKSD